MPLIEIGLATRNKLDSIANPGESYNSVVERLLILRNEHMNRKQEQEAI